jgi:hypothetical protein
MKRLLLCLFVALFVLYFESKGQFYYQRISFVDTNTYPFDIIPDTSLSPLWQLGGTNKPFFCSAMLCHSMMTDTVGPYPVNANNSFILSLKHYPFPEVFINPKIDIWHRYQTAIGKDGGIIEFSTDSGVTWTNVVGGCISEAPVSIITVDSFYTTNDTLQNGAASFTGSGILHSTLIFTDCIGSRSTSALSPCDFPFAQNFLIRFRFVSDSVPDSLSGWKIDSITIAEQDCPGGIKNVIKNHSLSIVPNPSYNGSFVFPQLENEMQYNVEIYNGIGERILRQSYSRELYLNGYPNGVYFYRVTNGTDYYSGKLIIE